MISRFKFVKKKECVVLTWPAKLLILLFLLTLIYISFTQIASFLSLNKAVNGDYLVLDGEMPDYSIQKAIKIFNKSDYKTVITTGGILPAGYYISGKTTMAELSYATFIELGFDSLKIYAIPGKTVLKDRTYNSGISLKNWFLENKINHAKIDIIAIGCHARRSRYLFQEALGSNFEVGVISIDDESFDISKWWKSSKGFRTVLSESIAFLYSKYLFYPENKTTK